MIFQVAVAARNDVPHFGPALPETRTFTKGPEFRDFILAKIINAERAAYKAERFARLGVSQVIADVKLN